MLVVQNRVHFSVRETLPMFGYSSTLMPGLELQSLEIHPAESIAPCWNTNCVRSATAYREEEMQLAHRLAGDRHGTWAEEEMTSRDEMRAEASWPFIDLSKCHEPRWNNRARRPVVRDLRCERISFIFWCCLRLCPAVSPSAPRSLSNL